MAEAAAQIPEPFNVHAWLVKPSGFGAGVTFTQDRKLLVLEAEWEWLAKGGSGPAMVKVEGDLGDPDTYVTDGWEIVLDIRLQPEVNYTRWYRGRIVDVKAAVVASKTVTTIRVQGQWAAEATNVKIDNDYDAGTQDVKTLIGDIIDSQGVDAQTRIVYDASLIAASTYTPATFDAVGSASRVIAALAETQGSREFDVDPDTRKFRMAAEVTTVAERNIYIVGKDVKELDSGDAHDRGTNTIVVTGRNDGGQARTSEVGDATDQAAYGKKMRHVILPYMSAAADLTQWANNQITDLKGRQEYSIFEVPDVQQRVEGTAPPIGNIKLWRRKSDSTSEAVSLPLHKVRYSYGVACDADYDQPECTPGEIRPRGRTIKALVFIGTPPPNLPEWNEKIELEKERISIWIQQGQVPDKYAGDPTNNLPEGRQWTEKLVADSTNKDLYLCTNTTGPAFVRIGGQNLAFKDEANAFTQENSFGSQKLTSVADPTSAQDAATKAYVDAVAVGIDWKPSVRVATTANITLSGEQTIDGVAVVANDRVLVKDQTAGAENGLYVASAGAWTRATDADTNAEVTAGLAVFVGEGTATGNRGWILTTNDPITLGTTALVFTQFLGPGADDHGELAGLADDDHTQYARTDGTRDITGIQDFDAGISLAGVAVTASAAELNIMDGVTATAAELNILDGVTSTAAELNILDGVTATAAELNIMDGVTLNAGQINNAAIKDEANIFTTDQRITSARPVFIAEATGQASLTRLGKALATNRTDLTTNIWWNGTGWVEDDTTAVGTKYTQLDGAHYFQTATAGTGPRTIVTQMQISAAGALLMGPGAGVTLSDTSGNLYQQGVLVASTAAQIDDAARKSVANTFTEQNKIVESDVGLLVSAVEGSVGATTSIRLGYNSGAAGTDNWANFRARNVTVAGGGADVFLEAAVAAGAGGSTWNTNQLVLTANNKVGVGVAAPDELLDVAGKIRFAGSAGGGDATLDFNSASNRTLTLPNATTTLGGLGVGQTWTGLNVFSLYLELQGDVSLAPTKRIYLDGPGVLGDSYLVQSAANIVEQFAGGISAWKAKTTGITVKGGMVVAFTFSDQDVPSESSNNDVKTEAASANTQYIMPMAGSVVGMSVALTAASTAGTATYTPTSNDANFDGTWVTMTGAESEQFDSTVKAIGTYTFAAGIRLGCHRSSAGPFAPGSNDAQVVVFVEFNTGAIA